MATLTLQKTFGAFYTDEPAATRLVDWAICDPRAVVLDPSCGAGVFLAAAVDRLLQLGCKSPQVYGVDISAAALQCARERVEKAQLIHSDFFDLAPGALPAFDCIVGNPPFIRYQTFNGKMTSKGHLRAVEAGARLPRLASSWAPFVIHAARFLRRGGRLAMVMPAELGHAMYARDVLRYLIQHFRHVGIEMFRDKLFGKLSQSTVLLLCEGYGEPCRVFVISSAADLQGSGRQMARVDISSVRNGTFRFTHYLVPDAVRELYLGLAADRRVQRLGEVADVGIGYVTGANEFFHLSDEERRRWDISTRFLRPAVLNLRGFNDIEYRREYWIEHRKRGKKAYLLAVPPVPRGSLPNSIGRYLREGEASGVPERYKCRIRQHWYVVPHVRIADAFLSYMSDGQPLLVTNAANLVAPNTIHLLRFADGRDPRCYAATWRNSLTRLSCELEGHALGGGLFKLEPSEAENVLVVHPRPSHVPVLFEQLRHGPAGSGDQVADLTDRYILKAKLGLTASDCLLLRDAAVKIESWRKHK